jgi:magnesium-transporting ATPase (P-type)
MSQGTTTTTQQPEMKISKVTEMTSTTPNPPGGAPSGHHAVDLHESVQGRPLDLVWAEWPEAINRLKCDINIDDPKTSKGLTNDEAAKRLAANGPNMLTPPKQRSEIVKYLLSYTDPFMLLLMSAGIWCEIAYGLDKTQPLNMWVGIVLFIAVFISSTFTYIQVSTHSFPPHMLIGGQGV